MIRRGRPVGGATFCGAGDSPAGVAARYVRRVRAPHTVVRGGVSDSRRDQAARWHGLTRTPVGSDDDAPDKIYMIRMFAGLQQTLEDSFLHRSHEIKQQDSRQAGTPQTLKSRARCRRFRDFPGLPLLASVAGSIASANCITTRKQKNASSPRSDASREQHSVLHDRSAATAFYIWSDRRRTMGR